MAMHVRISEPQLLPDLLDVFLRNGCVAQSLAEDSCIVVHVHAGNASEAWREVAFFLGAWQLDHPSVAADMTPVV
jgi:hypothetical protein